MILDDAEKRLVGRLLAATVDEFYPTSWFQWDEVAALRDRLAAQGVEFDSTVTSFDQAYPLPMRHRMPKRRSEKNRASD